METYRNINRDSGVLAYEIGSDYIKVQFSTGTYTYSNYGKAGIHHVNNMKNLAQQGTGLNAYINKNVKFKYD